MSLNSMTAKAVSASGAAVTVYTVPVGKEFANISLNLVNNNSDPATIRVGITNNAEMAELDAVEWNIQLAGNGGQLRRTSLFLSPGEKLIVYSDKSSVAIRAWGLEQN